MSLYFYLDFFLPQLIFLLYDSLFLGLVSWLIFKDEIGQKGTSHVAMTSLCLMEAIFNIYLG